MNFDNLKKTPHPKILRAQEAMLSQIEVAALMREIQLAIDAGNPDKLRKVVMARVDGYQTPAEVMRKA